MSKQREALQLALEALNVSIFDFKDAWHGTTYAENKIQEIQTKASNAIREALTEPEQEPVAWAHQPPGMSRIYSIEPIHGPHSIPLYSAPPARKPLTIEEITAIVQSMSAYTWDVYMLARAIERAHGIDGGHDCWR